MLPEMLVPQHYDGAVPLDEEHTRTLNAMAGKLMELIVSERRNLETELLPLLPTVSLQDGTLNGDRLNAYLGGFATFDETFTKVPDEPSGS